ncbi:MAG: UvrD-helicase domain-containing protein, partial [Halanaerobiaceae bacterium]|nr:UvrD-helicase domain-containing protein [Halanaerobiaceae bacterium]
MDYLTGLNPEQKKATESLAGPVLVLAGAGSGKTRTLTCRTANLIHNGVKPENILTVTFTNKAARDMEKKITGLLGKEKTRDMWLGTFHSVCLRILRDNLQKVDRFEGCLIYDTTDSIDIIEDILFEFNLDSLEYNPEIIYHVIEKGKINLVGPEKMIETYAREDKRSKLYYQHVAAIYREYERVLANNNSFDFNDLIKKTIELFEEYPGVLKDYQEKFQYLQVDEYQDVNHAQYRLCNMLAKPEDNIFVVGDDWQGIYGFRGADISNILDFERDYPSARVIKLEQNYRSTNNIITVSNQLIKNNSQNKEKAAWTEEEDGASVFITEATSTAVEARYIARRINDLVNYYNYRYGDIAILCRSHYQSTFIQRELPRAHIPYQVIGGVSFFDRQEISHLINYMRLLINPNDRLALKRVFHRDVEGVREILFSEMNKYAIENEMEITEVFGNPTVVKGIGKKKGENIREFKWTILNPLNRLRQKKMPLVDTIEELIDIVGFREKITDTMSNPAEREKYLDMFLDDIRNYQKYNPERNLHDYLLVNKLMGDQDELDENRENSVKVMTAHASKGLEFPVVFVLAAEEGVFPHQKSIEEAETGKNPYAIEEERRLFYVAMTRAQKLLFISFSRAGSDNGQMKET